MSLSNPWDVHGRDPRKPLELKEMAMTAAKILERITGETCLVVEHPGRRTYEIKRYCTGGKLGRG